MAQAPVQTVRLDARNMTCPVCPIAIKSSLEQLSFYRSHVRQP